MSGPEEENPEPPAPGRARATLAQIRLMWSADLFEEENRVLRIGMFGQRETWKRVSGSGSSTVFELQTEED